MKLEPGHYYRLTHNREIKKRVLGPGTLLKCTGIVRQAGKNGRGLYAEMAVIVDDKCHIHFVRVSNKHHGPGGFERVPSALHLLADCENVGLLP